MSYQHLADKPIKAVRKPHVCVWCGQRVEAGSPAHHTTGVFDGDFCSNYYHPECWAAQEAVLADDHYALIDGFMCGSFTRGRTDDERLPPEFAPDGRRVEAAKGEGD